MRTCRIAAFVAGLALVSAAPPVGAQHAHEQHGDAAAAAYTQEFLTGFDSRFERIIALAEAIPAETYTWRPAEGVRSVSETLLHVAGSTYYLFTFAGTEPPADLQLQGFEQSTTDKAEVIAQLQRAHEFARNAVAHGSQDADAEVGWFGDAQISHRDLLFRMTGHLGEHLGQMIAYARSNGVVPPWSR